MIGANLMIAQFKVIAGDRRMRAELRRRSAVVSEYLCYHGKHPLWPGVSQLSVGEET